MKEYTLAYKAPEGFLKPSQITTTDKMAIELERVSCAINDVPKDGLMKDSLKLHFYYLSKRSRVLFKEKNLKNHSTISTDL